MLKFHKIDWLRFCRALKNWELLRQPARQLFLSLSGNPRSMDAPSSSVLIDEIVEANLLISREESGTIMVPKEVIPFWRTMRALMTLSHETGPEFGDFDRLARALLSHSDRMALLPDHSPRDFDEKLRDTCASSDWLSGFLELEDSMQFESDHSRWDEAPHFVTPGSLPQTQDLVRRLLESESPIPIRELSDHCQLGPLSVILSAGFRYLLFFPGIDLETLTPFVYLWPQAHEHLRRPRPVAPRRVAMVREFSSPFLVDDMTRILAMTGQGLRVRVADGALFRKDERRIAADLEPIPDWLQDHVSTGTSGRISFAIEVMEQWHLMRFEEGRQGQLHRVISTRGRKWLSQSAGKRLRATADFLKKAKQSQRGEITYLPWHLSVHGPSHPPRLAKELQTAFLSLEDGESVSVRDFGRFHRMESNPLLELKRRGEISSIQFGWRSFWKPGSERLELLWHNFLLEFLCNRLFPMGGARLGVSRDGDLCFGLTDVGRYFLEATNEFDPGRPDESQVLVQPNFEITFLTPNPLAEADISRFSERIGKSPGIVFRITQDSIIAAAGSGLDSEQIIRSLSDASTQPIPANVATEIENWIARCRNVKLREAVVIECPDAETARRALSIGRRKVQLLNETTVEIVDPRAAPGLIKRWRKAGIFPD